MTIQRPTSNIEVGFVFLNKNDENSGVLNFLERGIHDSKVELFYILH